MVTEMKDTVDNFMKQTTEGWQTVFNAGVKAQEQTLKFFNLPFSGTKTFDDLRKKSEQWTTDVIGLLQKNVAESQKAFDAHCRRGLELTRKTFDTIASEEKADVREISLDLANTSFDAFRSTAEITMNSGIQMFENWTNFVAKAFNIGEKKPATK